MHIKQNFTIAYTGISVMLATSLALPSVASASVLDIFSGLLASRVTYVAPTSETSQDLQLLSAPRNSALHKASGGGDIVLRDGVAMVPALSPSAGPTRFIEGVHNGGKMSVYIVREGDTISTIAERFGVSTNTVRWANDLTKTSLIRPGQELIILPITGVRYVIKNGGTVRDVVKKVGGDVDEVASYNGVGADEELAKGTVVIVPNGELPAEQNVHKIVHHIASVAHRGARAVRGGVTARAHDVSQRALPGYFIHPLNHRGVKTQGIHGYNAIDFGAPVGTPIVASAGGTVILARPTGYNGGYGRYTIIKHPNGVQTLYAHMSKNISYVGQKVVQGQVIGYVGNTGRSTGPHLHFEVRGAKNPF